MPIMMTPANNVDHNEILKFTQLAGHFWDAKGPLKTLHAINPLRLHYIMQKTNIRDKKIVDIGCGGGILSESLAKNAAHVTGIDKSEEVLAVARQHPRDPAAYTIEYLDITAEALAEERAGHYDCVVCMELLEHVPNPEAVIAASAELVKPGGDLFFSTIHRTLKSYLFAILGAEYILKLLPQKTHDYEKFIRPSELTACARASGLTLMDLTGLSYSPLTHRFCLTRDVSVNYLAHFQKKDEGNVKGIA